MPSFLVCYDYGQGGIWLYIDAAEADEIQRIYPSLTVFESPPTFWTEDLEKIARQADPKMDPFWRDWLDQLKSKD